MPRPAPVSEFWARLTSLPAFQNMNQKQIGDVVDVGQTAANKWKIGLGLPTLDNAITLAGRGGVCVEWLLTERGPRSPDPDDPDTADLLRHWRILGPEGKARVLRYAKYEHAVQFTGDESARGEYQTKLAQHTNELRVQDRSPPPRPRRK